MEYLTQFRLPQFYIYRRIIIITIEISIRFEYWLLKCNQDNINTSLGPADHS